jgi:hypothetical protein
MTKPATDRPIRRKAGSPPHSAAWAVLGALGLGYLGIAFLAPQLLPDFSGGRQHIAETTVMKVSADVEGMKSSLTKLELDLASVKSEVNSQASQTQALSTQLTALDDKFRLAQSPAETSSAEPQSQPAAEVPAFASGAQQAQDADSGSPPTTIINSAPRVGAPIETGSVDSTKPSKPISFGPAVVKPAPKPVGIQLATDPSVDGLRVTWGALSQIHTAQLSRLKARYADLGTATNPNFGLIAGPVKSKAEAKKICKELTAEAVSCKVSEYRGEDL